jgi:hypothetical protein
VLVELREDLTDLTPEAPRELRMEYTNLLARLHINIYRYLYEQLPGDTTLDDTEHLQGHDSPGHESLTDVHFCTHPMYIDP